jgi:hypothetical protein
MKNIKVFNPEGFLEEIAESITKFTAGEPVQVDDYTLLAIKYKNK